MSRSRVTVLIFARGEVMQRLLNRRVAQAGYTAVICSDIKTAFSTISSQQTDVVLWDLDIYDLKKAGDDIKAINDIVRHDSTPLIVVADMDETWPHISKLKVTADSILKKPFDESDLVSKIEQKLQNHKRD